MPEVGRYAGVASIVAGVGWLVAVVSVTAAAGVLL